MPMNRFQHPCHDIPSLSKIWKHRAKLYSQDIRRNQCSSKIVEIKPNILFIIHVHRELPELDISTARIIAGPPADGSRRFENYQLRRACDIGRERNISNLWFRSRALTCMAARG